MPDEAERPEPETTTTRRQLLAASSRAESPPSAAAAGEEAPLALVPPLSQLCFSRGGWVGGVFSEVEGDREGGGGGRGGGEREKEKRGKRSRGEMSIAFRRRAFFASSEPPLPPSRHGLSHARSQKTHLGLLLLRRMRPPTSIFDVWREAKRRVN